MLIKIKFDDNGISNFSAISGDLKKGEQDVYELSQSSVGFYKRDSEGKVTPVTPSEYDDIFLDYGQKRQKEYPRISDQLDAILEHLDEAGVPADSKVEKIINDWRAVKAKYPKS